MSCNGHEFICSEGTCISYSWVCDGVKDCVGGDDEDYEHCGKYKRVLGIQISIKYQIGTLTKPNTGYF